MDNEIITSVIGFILGSGGVWGYVKAQNGKIENMLLQRVQALEISLKETRLELREANRKIELHESNMLVLVSGTKTLSNIARHNYENLTDQMKQQLIVTETRVDSIISMIESRNNQSF